MIPALKCILWDLMGRALHVGATLIIRNNYRRTWGRSPRQMINYTQRDKDALCETLMLFLQGHSKKHQILKINKQTQGKAYLTNTYQPIWFLHQHFFFFCGIFLSWLHRKIPHLQADLPLRTQREEASNTLTECYVIWRQNTDLRAPQKNLSSVLLHNW